MIKVFQDMVQVFMDMVQVDHDMIKVIHDIRFPTTGHDNRLHETRIIGHGECPIEQGTCPPWHGKDCWDMI
jgi:hypothetical protein